MVTQALEQLLQETSWRDLDYLIIDLPPGTGDTQLTLAQKVPVSGAVIVTTPQDIALLDVRKAVKMFEKVEIPVLGIVDNMSTYVCSHCGHEEHIFGKGGGKTIAQNLALTILDRSHSTGRFVPTLITGAPQWWRTQMVTWRVRTGTSLARQLDVWRLASGTTVMYSHQSSSRTTKRRI